MVKERRTTLIVVKKKMMDFMEEMNLNNKAREIKAQLSNEDNICNISDIISSLDEDMAKRVLKLFVYDN